jgi:hypothetical protein
VTQIEFTVHTPQAARYFRRAGRITCLLFALTGATTQSLIAAPTKLEYLELGPLKLKALKPGTITIFPQERILNAIVHHRFSIAASAGLFEYKSADGSVNILAGKIQGLSITGYISFSGEDEIGSMVVEQRDQLRFVLLPETYSLPTYGGGTITLEQHRVWVGNSTPVDLLNHTGSIYFASDAVLWKGIRVVTAAPALSFSVDARNRIPKAGVRFLFDLSTARLGLDEGAFRSTAIRSVEGAVAQPAAGEGASLGTVAGTLLIDVHKAAVTVSAAKLTAELTAASVAPTHLVPVVAVGNVSLSNLRSVAQWDASQVSLRQLSASGGSFAPDAGVRLASDAWQSSTVASLLHRLGLAGPAELRAIALKETMDRLASLGSNLAFAEVRRTLIDKLIRKAFSGLKSVMPGTTSFGEQSIAVPVTYAAAIPLAATRAVLPMDVELTPDLQEGMAVLRPATRMLLLGGFSVPSAFRVSDLIDRLRARLVSIVEKNETGFSDIGIPVQLTLGVDVDLGSLSTEDFKITSPQFTLPLDLRAVVVITSDSLWILSEVAIK